MDADELRGSTPVLSAKDLLLELRGDVRGMREGLSLLTAQNVPERLSALEAWRNQIMGRMIATFVLCGLGLVILGLMLDHLVLQS